MPSPLRGRLLAFAAEGDNSILILLFSYFLVYILLSGGKLLGCMQQNRLARDNCDFKLFVLKTLPDAPRCRGNQFVNGYLGLKDSGCCCKLTSDQRHLFSTGKTASQEKRWGETLSACKFLLSLCDCFWGAGGCWGHPCGGTNGDVELVPCTAAAPVPASRSCCPHNPGEKWH